MYILKNAVTSILRNKGRNLLIGIIIFVIFCATSITLAIDNSASKLIDSYKEKYEVEATIGVNRESMMQQFNPQDSNSNKNMRENFNNISNISIEDIEKYADSKYVKNYYYTMSVGVNSSNLVKAPLSDNDAGDNEGWKRQKDKFNNQTSGDFILNGYSSVEAMSEFIEGSYKITSGEISEDMNGSNCIINSELAALNNISVGDKITIIDASLESNSYELTVTGIYEEESSNDNEISMFSNSVNTIITNTSVLTKMIDANSELNVTTKSVFTLTGSDIIDDFYKELQSKGLSEYLKVETNMDQVENATSAISNVKSFAVTFLIITLIIGTIVLLVINMINLRERKYEIGVLRTIGMKKSTVCLQFLYELVIVSFVSLLLGAIAGSALSVPVSNKLLKSEIASSQNEKNNIRQNFGKIKGNDTNRLNPDNGFSDKKFNGIANIQAFDSIDAVVDVKVLLELIVIGLIVVLVSGTSALISIQRFSPLTILKERS